MRGARHVVVVGLGLGLVSMSVARAESPPAPTTPASTAAAVAPTTPAPSVAAPAPSAALAPKPKTFPRLAAPTMSHYLQFGIGLLAGTGYRGIFPYQEMVYCGKGTDRVCTGRLPAFLDVQPSFGFAHRWDVLADLRFGLETDFTQSREFALAPGVRYWVDPDESAKFFATIQAVYDTTPQHNTTLHNDDLALRNSNGFMFEIMRNLGVYVQFGETIGFWRWLRFEIDGGVGVQARLP